MGELSGVVGGSITIGVTAGVGEPPGVSMGVTGETMMGVTTGVTGDSETIGVTMGVTMGVTGDSRTGVGVTCPILGVAFCRFLRALS